MVVLARVVSMVSPCIVLVSAIRDVLKVSSVESFIGGAVVEYKAIPVFFSEASVVTICCGQQ